MRVKFTSTLDEHILEQLKIEAIKKKVSANDILEDLMQKYLSGDVAASKSILTDDELKDACDIIHQLLDWSWHNAVGAAQEKEQECKRNKESKKAQQEVYDATFSRTIDDSHKKIQKLQSYFEKLSSV